MHEQHAHTVICLPNDWLDKNGERVSIHLYMFAKWLELVEQINA
jgi:hypothetical protein